MTARQFKINRRDVVAALDIGASSFRCAAAIQKPSGDLEKLAYAERESAGVRGGRITDFELASNSAARVMEAAEEEAGVSFSEMFVGFSAPFHAFRSAGMAALPSREVRLKDMRLAVATACAVPLPDRCIQIHSLPQMFSVDGGPPAANPEGLSGLRLETRVFIVAAEEFYLRDTAKVLREAGGSLRGFVHNLTAFAEAAVLEERKREGICFCDIGRDSSRAVVYKDGEMVDMFETAFGGEDFSKALAARFKIPLPDAERLKRRYGRFDSRRINEEDQIEFSGAGGASADARATTSGGRFLSRKSLALALESCAKKFFITLKKQLRSINRLKDVQSRYLFTGRTAFAPGFLSLAEAELGESVLQDMGAGDARNFQENNTFAIIEQALRRGAPVVPRRPRAGRWAGRFRSLFSGDRL